MDLQSTEIHCYTKRNIYFTPEPLNPAFDALLLVSIMPQLNYFLRKINSIKVSLGRGSYIISISHALTDQGKQVQIFLSFATEELYFGHFSSLKSSKTLSTIILPPPLSLDPISSELRGSPICYSRSLNH